MEQTYTLKITVTNATRTDVKDISALLFQLYEYSEDGFDYEIIEEEN